MARKEITQGKISDAFGDLNQHMIDVLMRKGRNSFASRHEAMGLLLEEWEELKQANQSNNMKEFKDELLDVAVTCLFTLACINDDALDW